MDETTGQLLNLLDEFGTRLHALLTRITLRQDAAEDLMQELFLRLQHSEAFGHSSQPDRYLFRAAINLAFDWRRANCRPEIGSAFLDDEPVQPPAPIEGLIRSEELECILSALEQLSNADRELITLRYIEGEAHDDLAKRLGRTRHQVRALCSKAIARLRRQVRRMTAECPEREVSDAHEP
ncbi:RNA polymerase sigma factor [Planctomycetota bacterium]